MVNNNVVIKASGTNGVQIGNQHFPIGALWADTRLDTQVSFKTVHGLMVTNFLNFANYSNSSNAPYASFAALLSDIQALVL